MYIYSKSDNLKKKVFNEPCVPEGNLNLVLLA